MALPPNRRNLILLGRPIAALMLLTLPMAVASRSPTGALPTTTVAATTATPTAEPTVLSAWQDMTILTRTTRSPGLARP